MTRLLPNQFDRSKPFYPLVVHYTTLVVGFKELALRGVAGPPDFDELVRRIPRMKDVPVELVATADIVRDRLRKLGGPLELKSEFGNDRLEIEVDEIAKEVVANFTYLSSVVMKSAGSLLILAHEISKDEPWHDQGELWEFLRHCRNAAAHGGHFNFLHGEPRRLARWGTLEISAALQGTALFKDEKGGFLSPGDPIRLLYDIERAYPQMHM